MAGNDILKQKAQENFDVAKSCAQNGNFNAWANRAWYALYQVGTCFLLKFYSNNCTRKIITAKGQKITYPYFGHEYLRDKIIRFNSHKETKRVYKNLLDYRVRSDYADMELIYENDYKFIEKSLEKVFCNIMQLV